MNRQGRPTEPFEAVPTAPNTFTGNRALRIEEALIFEIGRPEVTGVDLDEPAAFTPRLGGLERKAPIGLPGLAEPEAVRHYVRLSRMNYGIDTGVFPLGSCTMKHNPRLNEKMARLPGFGDIHPLQPQSTVPGALELIAELVALAVRTHRHAGGRAHAEGRRAWRTVRHDGDQGGARGARRDAFGGAGAGVGTWHQSGDRRAARLSRRSPFRRAPDGTVDPEEVKKHLSKDVAAIMLTNPNTCGLFERDVVGDRRGRARGRRVLLCRRRELQRDRRQGAARAISASMRCTSICTRRSRRRTAAAARAPARWRCRPRSRRLRRCLMWSPTRMASGSSSIAGDGDGKAVRPHVRLPRPDGHVRARDELHAGARLGRHAAGVGRCGAQRELRARRAEGPDVAAVRRPRLHARGAVRRSLARGHRRLHARFRQGDDRRGLSSDDDVFPARGAWRDADRADRVGEQSLARSLHRGAARSRAWRRNAATPRGSPARPITRRAAASTRRAPRVSRCCAGSSPRRRRRRRSRCPQPSGRGAHALRSRLDGTPTTPCSSAPDSTGTRRPASPRGRCPARRNGRRGSGCGSPPAC